MALPPANDSTDAVPSSLRMFSVHVTTAVSGSSAPAGIVVTAMSVRKNWM